MEVAVFDPTINTDLQSFNHVIAYSLDELKSMVDEIVNVLDPDFATKEQLPIIAALLNAPININETEDFQRKQIKNTVAMLKSKGTIESFKVLFYTFGFQVDVTPLWTADYTKYVPISPPYIVVNSLPTLEYGEQTIEVINPDLQFDTRSDVFSAV